MFASSAPARKSTRRAAGFALPSLRAKRSNPDLGSEHLSGSVWIASLSLAMTISPCSRAMLQRLVVQASNQADPPERARAKSRFFPRFVCFQAFARRKSFPLCLADAAPPPWISDRDRARRGPSSTLVPDREPSDREQRRSRVAPFILGAGRFRQPRTGLAQNQEFLPHFVSFQGLARRKISAPVETRIRSSPPPTHGPCRKRLVSPRSHAVAHRRTRGAVTRGLSPRSERCPRGS